MKNLLYIVLSFLVLTQSAAADDKRVAEELLKGKLDSVISVLQTKDLEKDVKKQRIIEIIEPIFDFPLMGKLALGRKHWPALPREKRATYHSLFVKRLKEAYLEKMALYTDETIAYQEAIAVRKKVHVPTHAISKEKKIAMLYKLYKSKNGWKIYDVEIEGVSIISSYRSQLDEILTTGTVDDLLYKLETPVEVKPSAATQ